MHECHGTYGQKGVRRQVPKAQFNGGRYIVSNMRVIRLIRISNAYAWNWLCCPKDLMPAKNCFRRNGPNPHSTY